MAERDSMSKGEEWGWANAFLRPASLGKKSEQIQWEALGLTRPSCKCLILKKPALRAAGNGSLKVFCGKERIWLGNKSAVRWIPKPADPCRAKRFHLVGQWFKWHLTTSAWISAIKLSAPKLMKIDERELEKIGGEKKLTWILQSREGRGRFLVP